MGLYDRDYYRESTRYAFSDWFGQRAVVALIAFTSCVYLVQIASRINAGHDRLSEFGAFHAPSIFGGEVWRLLTPVFLHSPFDPMHLIFNMLALYVFGTAVETVIGAKEFIGFYLVAGVVGCLLELFIRGSGIANLAVQSVGASGAVTAVAVLFACNSPHRGMSLLVLPVSIPAWLLVSGYLFIDVVGVLRPAGNVNHIAHLCGAAFGLLYHFADLRITGRWPSLPRRPRSRPALRLLPLDDYDDADTPTQTVNAAAPAADDNLEARMDRVLAKMKDHGRDSLTPEEHDVLLKASELYKQRRRGP